MSVVVDADVDVDVDVDVVGSVDVVDRVSTGVFGVKCITLTRTSSGSPATASPC